jgi:hypothetical protein
MSRYPRTVDERKRKRREILVVCSPKLDPRRQQQGVRSIARTERPLMARPTNHALADGAIRTGQLPSRTSKRWSQASLLLANRL